MLMLEVISQQYVIVLICPFAYFKEGHEEKSLGSGRVGHRLSQVLFFSSFDFSPLAYKASNFLSHLSAPAFPHVISPSSVQFLCVFTSLKRHLAVIQAINH